MIKVRVLNNEQSEHCFEVGSIVTFIEQWAPINEDDFSMCDFSGIDPETGDRVAQIMAAGEYEVIE